MCKWGHDAVPSDQNDELSMLDGCGVMMMGLTYAVPVRPRDMVDESLGCRINPGMAVRWFDQVLLDTLTCILEIKIMEKCSIDGQIGSPC